MKKFFQTARYTDAGFPPTAAGGKIVAEVSDSAQPFNPLKQVPPPDLKADVYSRSVGGLGIFLVKEYMDDVSYRRENGKNILSMKRKIAGGGGAQ